MVEVKKPIEISPESPEEPGIGPKGEAQIPQVPAETPPAAETPTPTPSIPEIPSEIPEDKTPAKEPDLGVEQKPLHEPSGELKTDTPSHAADAEDRLRRLSETGEVPKE